MTDKRSDVDCPDNPGTGRVYHCNSLDCPVHGKRNANELIRARVAARPNSWKLGCKTRGDSEWAYNGLRFPTREACLKYGQDLYSRWTALDTYEAHPSDDTPNMPG